ncbi:MAG: MraY family glycosyltransferase [Thermoguttaceae bacterium]
MAGVVTSVLLGRFIGAEISLTVSLTICAGLICLVGMIDDRFFLTARGKLLGQILAVSPMVMVGPSIEWISCFGGEISLGWFAVPWTLGWLLLGMNALNLLDGSDGLASTVGILISLAVAVVAAAQGLAAVAMLALVMAVAVAGFLVYNLPPARIYLGDSGSTLIGFMATSLAMHVSCIWPGTMDLPVFGLLLFVPLFDTSLAILRRTLKGQAVWTGDRGHLHHQLQDRGFTATKILLVLGGLGLAAGLAACAAVCWHQELLATLALASLTGLLIYRQWIARQEWLLLVRLLHQWSGASLPKPSALPPAVQPEWVLRPLVLDEPMQTPSPVGDRVHQERRAA